MSSTVKRGSSPPPTGVGKKHHLAQNNGSGPPPLSYPSEPADDVNMNEVLDEKVEIEFIQPNGKTTHISIDSSIPMYDLRIQLAARCKVSPSGHTLVVFSDTSGGPLDYTATQPIGSLQGRTVQLLAKNSDVDKSKKFNKESSKGVRPFEMTHRFTVNLPRNQKTVVRISPSMTLEQLQVKICQDKNFDPSRYTFQHAANPQISLSAKTTVAELQCPEINFVPIGMMDSAQSMPNLAQDWMPTYMPATETRKKRGFLSFLRKDKKLKLHDVQTDTGPVVNQKHSSVIVTSSSTPPPRRNSFGQTRPKSMFVGTAPPDEEHVENGFTPVKETTAPKAAAKGVKKRHAPPPPQQKVAPATVEIKVKDSGSEEKDMEKLDNVKMAGKVDGSKNEITVQADMNGSSNNNSVKNVQRLHSRNSSDSSGYHELTLSGAESPEAHRATTAFKTSIDATSIESTENNISDISRVQAARAAQGGVPGDSQTLPLNRSSSKPPRRSHSLERNDKSNKPALPSSKTKRAPAPPGKSPQKTETNLSSSQTASATEQKRFADDKEKHKSQSAVREDVHDGVLNDGEMMMVEDTSICSEDIDNIELAKIRPCEFVAPPPPSEPPPQDMPPVDYSPALAHRNTPETTDAETEVNDNASLGPTSAKTSPQSVHSRTNSQTSTCSANSIDDIGLSFEQTIAAAEEALANEQQQEAETSYKTEMAIFVERMSMLTENADGPESCDVDDVLQSLDDMDSNSDTGSVIRHDTSNTSDIITHKHSGSESGSVASSTHIRQTSEHSLSPRDEVVAEQSNLDNEVAEINLTMPVVPPPPEFQNDSGPCARDSPVVSQLKLDLSSLEMEESSPVQDAGTKEEDSEEEYIETTEEVIVNFAPQSGYTFGGAYRIPDLESRKEYTHVHHSPRSQYTEPKLSYSSFDAGLSSNREKSKVNNNTPREKEEFVLSLDDLQNISYTAGSRKPNKQPHSVVEQNKNDSHQVVDERAYSSSEATVQSEPLYSDVIVTEQISLHEDMRQRCPDLSFPSHSEGEVDSLLEEKSISQIALPAIRTNVTSTPNDLSDSDSESDKYTSTTSVVLGATSSPSSNTVNSGLTGGHELEMTSGETLDFGKTDMGMKFEDEDEDEDDDDIEKQQLAMQERYEMLQRQFNEWQQQLLENQKLLASKQIVPEKTQSLMLQQMQMQQQLMLQLQQSMQALDLQKQHSRSASSIKDNSPQMSASEMDYSLEPTATDSQSMNIFPTAATENMFYNVPQVEKRANVDASSSMRTGEGSVPTAPPVAPILPKQGQFGLKPVQKERPRPDPKRFERQLDPREELMIAVRHFGGRNGLKMVPVQQTNWHVNVADVNTGL